MPRMAAALGLVATVAFCIGFNVKRYPRVWEMVAPRAVSGVTPAAVAQTSPSANEATSAATEGKPATKQKKPAQRTPVANISVEEETEKKPVQHETDDSPETTGNRWRPADEAEPSPAYKPFAPIPVNTTPASAKAFAPIPSPRGAEGEKAARAAAAKREGNLAAKSDKAKADGDKSGKRPSQKSTHPGGANRNKPSDEKSTSAQAKRAPGGEKKPLAVAKREAENSLGGRPMVPFVMSSSAQPEPNDPYGSASAYDAALALKRLPLVDPDLPPSDPDAVVAPGEVLPNYPTTDLQRD